MLQQIINCARPLTSSDIAALQHRTGTKLPEAYKRFLLKYNGGQPTPAKFPIRDMPNLFPGMSRFPNTIGVIQVFFGLERSIESSNLDWGVETFNGRIPSNLFPIACTGTGEILCLSLFGDDEGAVVLWDWHRPTPQPSYDNVHHVADT